MLALLVAGQGRDNLVEAPIAAAGAGRAKRSQVSQRGTPHPMAPAAARRPVADGAVSKETSYESPDGGRNCGSEQGFV